MKRGLIPLFLFLGLTPVLDAQNPLKPVWKFNTGDNPAWAWPGFDDSSWDTIEAGTAWEDQGFADYDGFAWYRQEVFIPGTWRKRAERNGGLVLKLGRIDDADVTYFNGQILGATGGLPPEYLSAYGELRAYTVPVDRITWNAQNTIAIRVFDGGGKGGIAGDPASLTIRGMEELVDLVPMMAREDHLFLHDGPVSFELMMENRMNETVKGTLRITATSDFGDIVLDQMDDVRIGAGGLREKTVEMGTMPPGFYRILIGLESETESKQLVFALGVRPEEIISPPDRPDDFEDYWRRARRELDAVDPQFNLIRQDDLCTDTREIYLLEMRSLGNVLIRGWYMRPVRDGVYPAILHLQGYSSTMGPQNLYQGDDMVSLALNIRGHGNSRDDVDPGFPGYLQYHVDNKEEYIYRGAYMDCVRAVDFLYSRNEVDTSRVAVEGGSQGGALTFATAALDAGRINLCLPHVPFLSDFRDYFKVAGWPGNEFLRYLEEHPGIPEEVIYRNLSYIDIKNLAPWIKAPLRMAIGLMDQTCPPHINFAAYNQVGGQKEYIVYPGAGHGLPVEYRQEMFNYIRMQFHLNSPEE